MKFIVSMPNGEQIVLDASETTMRRYARNGRDIEGYRTTLINRLQGKPNTFVYGSGGYNYLFLTFDAKVGDKLHQVTIYKVNNGVGNGKTKI